MADTIQLKLLENRTIVAEINGRNYAYEGGYKIIAGEENATEFEISSVPLQYADFLFSVAMTNSRGQIVESPEIVDNKFMLPVGMAVAGYGQIVITAHGVTENGETVTVPFFPLKIPVANTNPNWTSGIINGTITIGKVETLPPDSKAYAVNTGTSTDAIINLGIPQGQSGKDGKDGEDALPIRILGQVYYDPTLSYSWSTADLISLPAFVDTQEGTAYLVDDNEVKGQYDLYIHNYGATAWVIINNWGGIPGQQGEQGEQGVGILTIISNGTDADGGNVYKIMLTNGDSYDFTAPKGSTGATGATGNGIQSTTITYAASTSGTTTPTTWQSSIPTVAQGNYLWTRTVTTYTDGTTKTSYTKAYQGKDGKAADTGNFYTGCTTEATNPTKVVTIQGDFSLDDGPLRITIRFTKANTASSPTLNVNGTGDIPIRADGDTTYVKWLADTVMDLVYLGSYWVIVGGYQLTGMRVGTVVTRYDNTSPATLYGGSWTQLPTGRFLRNVTSGTAGSTGGSDIHSHNVEGYADINLGEYSILANGIPAYFECNYEMAFTDSTGYTTYQSADFATVVEGVTDAESNIPPYVGVYMWRRTA